MSVALLLHFSTQRTFEESFSSPSPSSGSPSCSPLRACRCSHFLQRSLASSPPATSSSSPSCRSTWHSRLLGRCTHELSFHAVQTARRHRHPQRQVHLRQRSHLRLHRCLAYPRTMGENHLRLLLGG